MASKNQPGAFDCYANAEEDEPMFVLLGRDPHAHHLVRLWADMRRRTGEEQAKIDEALRCADAMEAWAKARGKDLSKAEDEYGDAVELENEYSGRANRPGGPGAA